MTATLIAIFFDSGLRPNYSGIAEKILGPEFMFELGSIYGLGRHSGIVEEWAETQNAGTAGHNFSLANSNGTP